MTIEELMGQLKDLVDSGVSPSTLVVTPSDDYFMNRPTKLVVGFAETGSVALFYPGKPYPKAEDTPLVAAVLID